MKTLENKFVNAIYTSRITKVKVSIMVKWLNHPQSGVYVSSKNVIYYQQELTFNN